ncbi:MAG: malate dehydrogenase [Oligoflexales bacterium]|nr:malate dehydrogenase [Oligoflexales bacterium]
METVHVAITGAAGQIGYSMLFRLASGEVFGHDKKVHLHLLELPQAIKAAEGTAMEIDDCGFDTLAGVDCYDKAEEAFKGVNWALLVGSMPRGPGMERSDLIKANGPIFVGQGQALNKAAADVRVVVVGNPCNTNALIAQHNCREIPATQFSAMTALDENRAKAQLAKKSGVGVEHIKNMIVWGNHSTTMYPDYENVSINGKAAPEVISDHNWFESEFIPCVQKRGAAIIAARGKSSAASAASACLDHIKRFITPSKPGECFSAAVPSDGKLYDIPRGLMFSFPIKSLGQGKYEIASDFNLSANAQAKLKKTSDELVSEREVVKDLLG